MKKRQKSNSHLCVKCLKKDYTFNSPENLCDACWIDWWVSIEKDPVLRELWKKETQRNFKKDFKQQNKKY